MTSEVQFASAVTAPIVDIRVRGNASLNTNIDHSSKRVYR